MGRAQPLAVTVTCLVASVSYAGSVTPWALGVFVLPGVVIAALIAWPLAAHRMSGAALILGGLLVLGWSELVNIWSGDTNGPAARSTFVAGGCSLVAAVAARSRWPALFLVAVAGAVVGALILGAGGEVPSVAVAATVCAALTLGWLEQLRRNWAAPPRREPAFLVLSLLAAAVTVGVVLLQNQSDPRQPEVLGPGRAYPRIKPAWTDPLAPAAHSPSASAQRLSQRRTRRTSHASTQPARRTHRRPSVRPEHPSQSSMWLWVLTAVVAAALALALLVAARLLAVRLAWRRVRQRLTAGTPAEQVTGAWAWTRIRLAACRLPLAQDVSPDVVTAGRVVDDLPPDAFKPLRALATAATRAAFAPDQFVSVGDAAAAWRAAGRVEASARELLPRRARLGLALRSPAPEVRTG